MMKVGFITTIDTNIGDDFIRQGIVNILKAAYPSVKFEFICVNKHFPYTAYPAWHPLHHFPSMKRIRGVNRIQRILKKPLARLGGSKFDRCDLIIQSGAPVLWPDCERCEWNIPIWQEIVGRLHNKIPVFNLAAGSCYPWEKQSAKFSSEEEKQYARTIGSYCQLTTTRDSLAFKLFDEAGVQNSLFPCTAFFVDSNFSNEHKKEYILINYMSGGGHFDWGQQIDRMEWEKTLKHVIRNLKKNNDVRFICHDEKEVQLAKELDPSLKIHFPKTISEYLDCIRVAKLGINNRMHASVAMGSVGVPSVSVCTDTRLLMLHNIGLPISYVKDIDAGELMAISDKLLSDVEYEKERLLNLKKKKFEQYLQLFQKHLPDN